MMGPGHAIRYRVRLASGRESDEPAALSQGGSAMPITVHRPSRHSTTLAALGFLAAAATPLPARAQTATVGAVEVYGARSVSPDDVRRAVGVAPGDPAPEAETAIRERLLRIPGVADAVVSLVCCESGRTVIYAGVREDSASPLEVRPAPTGIVSIPDDVVRTEAEFTTALREAVERGQAEEDHAAGHALMRYSPARMVQLRFVALAQTYEQELRDVLATSRFPMQRALAAQVLAYLPDKAKVAELLGPALTDPSPAVRNDAARALWIIAEYARDKPDVRSRIPVDPLVRMLASVSWTDRNKSSLVLMALTSARDSTLLATLDARSRAELEEMARWNTQHALPAFVMLGRIRGLTDDEIFGAWSSGERSRVLR